VETTNQKGIKGGRKPHMPKPGEQGDIPQYRHSTLAKYSDDRNPKCHEQLRKYVTRTSPHILAIFAAQKSVEREEEYIDERSIACEHKWQNAMNESPQHPCHGGDELPPRYPGY
jgi:hypothetical protein